MFRSQPSARRCRAAVAGDDVARAGAGAADGVAAGPVLNRDAAVRVPDRRASRGVHADVVPADLAGGRGVPVMRMPTLLLPDTTFRAPAVVPPTSFRRRQ